MNTKIKIEDMTLTDDQLSMIIQALDDMDVLTITDYDHSGSGYGTCMFSTDIVDIERDDDEQFVQMTITRVNHTGNRTIDDEILLEYPEELSSIPGIDVAKLCWHLFESDDPWRLNVECAYSLTEALYEFSEISGPYYESARVEELIIKKVILRCEHDDYDVTEMLDEETMRMLSRYCDDYIEEHTEDLKD